LIYQLGKDYIAILSQVKRNSVASAVSPQVFDCSSGTAETLDFCEIEHSFGCRIRQNDQNSKETNDSELILCIDIAIKAGLNELVMKSRPQESVAGFSTSLWNKAYYRIRERILRGEFSPGEALSARRLAEEFGMSLLPISQAFRQLESEKLLESRPRAGTRVRMPQPEEIRGRCIVREALEAQSARLCAVNATMKERVELTRVAQQLDTLYDRFGQSGSDPELQYVVHTLHFELHMRVAEYARCEELKDAIEKNQVLIYNWFFDLATNRRSLPAGFHSQLMEIVTGSDPNAADEAMRSHVKYGVPELLKQTMLPTTNDWRLRRSQASDKVGHASVVKPHAASATD
jgi:DNA-binding GntR family transcriptional regulator